jgi:hypothetical protein
MKYLISLNQPLKGCSLEGFVTIWDRFRAWVFGAKVLGHRWLLFNTFALLGVLWKHGVEVV